MRKLMFILFFTSIFVSCKDRTITDPIVISRMNDLETELTITLTDEEEIKAFCELLNNAKKIGGILDIVKYPTYKTSNECSGELVTYEFEIFKDHEQYYGMYFKNNDTHIGYSLLEKDIIDFIDLVDHEQLVTIVE